MKVLTRFIILLFSLTAALNLQAASRFQASEGTFTLDGKPFIIKAAELHYPRIPRPYWEHRIKMCKSLGMNTICLYVFWNLHESEPGIFDFSDNKDLAEFIRLCADNDMYVILRPGPYVCAEWEMGGLPWWLLKDEDIRLREGDPRFLERVEIFENEVANQVARFSIDNGGPILMVQVENEYGSYGTDKPYVSAIRDIVRKNWGEEMTLFQCDWESNFLNNGLDDLIWTMNFGTGTDVDSQFKKLREIRPSSPLMCSEYWSGWFDKWGAAHETRPADAMTAGISEMLDKGISFSLYMTHGGTNRGHWAGANSPGYAPDVTSYDYDAPIDEQGRATEKYHLLRETLQRYAEAPLPDMPDSIPVMAVEPFSLTEVAPFDSNLPAPLYDSLPRPMEMYDQGFGSIIYRTILPDTKESRLVIDELHDFGIISVNGRKIGTIDRRKGENSLLLPFTQAGDTLDIFVEATGRINFGRAIKDYKGITHSVRLESPEGAIPLTGWQIFLLPDDCDNYRSRTFIPLTEIAGHQFPPGIYKGTFTLPDDKVPADTFLDFSSWGKGLVYVNGYPLGRIWHIGPQQTIYTPGCWLKAGENEVIVMDVIGPSSPRIEGLHYPVNDRLLEDNEIPVIDRTPEGCILIGESTMQPGNGWKKIEFAAPVGGSTLYLEITDNESPSAIAELYLIDAAGKRIARESWKPAAASGSDLNGNHTPDKLFDQQESTFWRADATKSSPHLIAIDLGAPYELSGLELLPRTEKGAPGLPRNIKAYIK